MTQCTVSSIILNEQFVIIFIVKKQTVQFLPWYKLFLLTVSEMSLRAGMFAVTDMHSTAFGYLLSTILCSPQLGCDAIFIRLFYTLCFLKTSKLYPTWKSEVTS